MWSVPERLRGFATRHYVNPLYLFTFPLLQRSVDSRLTYLIAKSLTSNIQQWRLHRAAHKSQVRGQGFLCPAAVRARNGYYQYRWTWTVTIHTGFQTQFENIFCLLLFRSGTALMLLYRRPCTISLCRHNASSVYCRRRATNSYFNSLISYLTT